MKAIVVYYSLEGNTQYVADEIAARIGADTLKLVPQKAYPTGKVSKFIWGGRSVLFGEKPALMPYQFKAEDYDVIIIGTPVWANKIVPPLNTFLEEQVLLDKTIALYACSSGGDAKNA